MKHQVRVSSAAGGDVPADDDHSWRKYGQKEILGAKNPRLVLFFSSYPFGSRSARVSFFASGIEIISFYFFLSLSFLGFGCCGLSSGWVKVAASALLPNTWPPLVP